MRPAVEKLPVLDLFVVGVRRKESGKTAVDPVIVSVDPVNEPGLAKQA
jgi:hypothetical protein